jgi:hypothetical protein
MYKLLIVATLALAITAEPEADPHRLYNNYGYYPSTYAAYRPSYYNSMYKPYAYNSYQAPFAYRHKREAEAEPEADPQVYMAASPYAYPSAQYAYPAAQYAYPAAQYAYPTAYPTTSYQYVAPSVVAPTVSYKPTVHAPTVAYKPSVYSAAADPLFFGMGSLFNNNFGGKASYGSNSYSPSGYPSAAGHNDHYLGHFHINDGWGLWDEDLRDQDTPKADKFGSNKDGGR